MANIRIGFIGAGTVGNALALGLTRAKATGLSTGGYQVVAVSSRTGTSADRLAGEISGCKAVAGNQAVADAADVVFITTPDGTIPQVAAEVRWRKGQSVVHCSGADSTETLEPARKLGASVGAFHPLQTFASVKQAIDNLPGSTFAIEAEEPLRTTLKAMAAALGGHSIELRAGDKVVYHAAAVIASNYLVTLVKLSTDLWQTFNVPRDEATRALMPLLRGTLNNIANVGIPDCLTGPVARGDSGTVRKHLKALEKTAPAVLSTYRELGRQTVPVAVAKGKINGQQAQELQELLKETPACRGQETHNRGEAR